MEMDTGRKCLLRGVGRFLRFGIELEHNYFMNMALFVIDRKVGRSFFTVLWLGTLSNKSLHSGKEIY